MRFSAFRQDATPFASAIDGQSAEPLGAGTLLGALRADPDPANWERRAAIETDGLALAAPIEPPKIVAIGLNYRDHVRETGLEEPTEPLIFAKFPSCVTGPTDDIRLPSLAPDKVDWEVELGVVIGRRIEDAYPSEALEAVFGYTVANDVSARDVQFADVQWVRGKSFDSFCPLGPIVITPDELGDPQALPLRTRVNGELVQDSSTSEMIFGVAELLSYCSRCFPLDPGDLVLTGTPWGCGAWSDPPRALQPGDVVECEIDGIGVLRNEVVGPGADEESPR